MAILAGLLGFVGRFAGKVLTTTLGWASILLFGRVPGNRQIVLALITFGSVVWAALAIGVVLPSVGAFLVAVVPSQAFISEDWLRIGMLIGALVVPAVVGIASIFVVEPAKRPKGVAIAGQVLRGYPLSAALALTLVLLGLVGIARFVHHLARRWTDAHVAVIVRPGGYDQVVADLERALDDAGLAVDRRPLPVCWRFRADSSGRSRARAFGPSYPSSSSSSSAPASRWASIRPISRSRATRRASPGRGPPSPAASSPRQPG